QGAKISGASTDSCGTYGIAPIVSPLNGTVSIEADVATYFMAVSYGGHNYSFTAQVFPVSTTNVTVFIPSGNVNVSISQPYK
ncbi:MAG: hypothetical protein JRN15_06665, partial [Nitrososphaerota archaeon]|nr:hypothetical protein [Nitrososphaerota archaeon]